jgi:hypothetical protein
MKKVLAIATLVLSTGANAYTYNYTCKVGGTYYPLRLDDAAKGLEWRGNKYRVTATECGRYGWRATPKDNDELRPFDFCTATKGNASIRYGENFEIRCEMHMRRW